MYFEITDRPIAYSQTRPPFPTRRHATPVKTPPPFHEKAQEKRPIQRRRDDYSTRNVFRRDIDKSHSINMMLA
jgi:hypothetical protein